MRSSRRNTLYQMDAMSHRLDQSPVHAIHNYARDYNNLMRDDARGFDARAAGLLTHAGSMATMCIMAITFLLGAPASTCFRDWSWWLALAFMGSALVALAVASMFALVVSRERRFKEPPEPIKMLRRLKRTRRAVSVEAVEASIATIYNQAAWLQLERAENKAKTVERSQTLIVTATVFLVFFAVFWA